MGAAASASPATSPTAKWRRAARIVGGTVHHLHRYNNNNDLDELRSSPENQSKERQHVMSALPFAQAVRGPESSSPVSEFDLLHTKLAPDLTPRALELLRRIMTTNVTDFVHLDSFRDYCEDTGDWQLSDAKYELLKGFNMHVKAAVLQPNACVGTAVGVRIVISEFGVVNMMCAYDAKSDNSGPLNKRSSLLTAYVEHSLAMIYDLPRAAVAVAAWNPGHVAVLCCFESDSQKWSPHYKQKLVQKFNDRLRKAHSACSTFETIRQDTRERSLPVSFAARVLQRNWRKWAASKKGRTNIARRRRQVNTTTTNAGRGDSEAAPTNPNPTPTRHAEISTSPRFTRGEPEPDSMRRAVEETFEEKARGALDPWWRELDNCGGVGLVDAELQRFGTQVKDVLKSYEHDFVVVGHNELSLRTVEFVSPDANSLGRAGLATVCGQGSDGAEDDDDEFSDIMASTSFVRSAYGHHKVQSTTCVLRLRIQGLAAVLRRDLFDERFDRTIANSVRRVVGVPNESTVTVLGKRYGSVVVFVGIETAR